MIINYQQMTNQINRQFPEPFLRFPLILLSVKLLSSVCVVLIPLALEWVYTTISSDNILQPTVLFVSLVGCLYGLEIISGLLLVRHKLKIKELLSQKIVRKLVGRRSQYPVINILTGQLPVYINNYYDSYLSLVFELLKLGFIIYYLSDKLGPIIFLGLFIGLITMRLTFSLSKNIGRSAEANLKLREQKISLFKQFFNRLIDYKMVWLDKWIYQRVKFIQNTQFANLTKAKMTDCWCVGLWQFCSVGISAIVLSIYYAFTDPSIPQNRLHTPTIIYYFNLLNFPLNALSWNFAGLSNSLRIMSKINKILEEAEKQNQNQKTQLYLKDGILINNKEIEFAFNNQKIKIFPFQLPQGFYKVKGKFSSHFLQFLGDNTNGGSFVEQNSWHLPSVQQTICLNPSSQLQLDQNIRQSLLSAHCDDIPLQNSPETFSGGEKLRISLARAFYHGKLLIIDSQLLSLDSNLRKNVYESIKYNTIFRNITTIIKGQHGDDKDKGVNGIIQANTNQISITNFQVSRIQDMSMEWQLMDDSPKKLTEFYKHSENLKTNQNDNRNRSQKVSLKTYLFYFKSPVHVYFLLAICASSLLKHTYNYYINKIDIDSKQSSLEFTSTMIFFLIVFTVALFFRSYLFAKANLIDGERIAQKVTISSIMSNIDFYSNEGAQKQFKSTDQQIANSVEYTPSRLIHSNAFDVESICSSFPFQSNILFNNIFEVLASFMIMIYQVPLLGVFSLFLFFMVKKLDNNFRLQNQIMTTKLKDQQVKILQIVGHLQKGRKVLRSYAKIDSFINHYFAKNNQNIQLIWKNNLLKAKVNTVYRLYIIGFMAIGICLYVNVNDHDNKGLSVLINYSLILANYLLFLTMSFADTQSQAVSIQRVRRLTDSKQAEERIISFQEKLKKIKENIKKQISFQNVQRQELLLNLNNLNFSYVKGCPVLNNINLSLKKGQKIALSGKSGGGKTTLFKLLTGLYQTQQQDLYINPSINISLSPQHPLLLPSQTCLLHNLDPYNILIDMPQSYRLIFQQLRIKLFGAQNQDCLKMSYHQQLLINNYRGCLYGLNGITIYDQPQLVIQVDKKYESSTYIVVSHHKNFNTQSKYELVDGFMNLVK